MNLVANSNNLQELNRIFAAINQRLVQLESQNQSIINDIKDIKEHLSKIDR